MRGLKRRRRSAPGLKPEPERAFLPYTFAIVGVQKGGTSTLSWLLGKHSKVCRAPTKEVHFFDDEDRDWHNPDYADYRCPRRKPHQTVAGDASPLYLFWPHALERMRDYDPAMRLIATFRDPIERAFSHWSMQRGMRRFPDFSTIVANRSPASLPTELPRRESRTRFRRRSLVPRGYYGAQLRRGLEIFPREQWLLFDFHQIFAEYERTVDAMCDHIGIERFKSYPSLSSKMASPTDLTGEPPTAEDIAFLARLYEKDLADFADLSGIDVSAWSTSRILDGRLDPAELAERLARKAGLDRIA